MGLIPEQMEEKWFIYWQDNKLYFHRSWVGYCIYVVHFLAESDSYRMIAADVNRDPKQYTETSDERDAKMISFLIDEFLLDRPSAFPDDEPLSERQTFVAPGQARGVAEVGRPPEVAIPPEVAERLGYYVYLYVDPRTDKVFYVGKGQGARVLSHLSARRESEKTRILAELAAAGLRPRLEILAHALPTEETALRIEAAVIDLLGLDNLANLVSGWRSIQLGRMLLEDLIFYYAAKPVEITEPVLLIRVNRLYRHGMSAAELYDATRSCWKLGVRRENVKYAFAVFEGVVREVYEVEAWHPGQSTPDESGVHGRRKPPATSHTGKGPARWEFTGKVAPEPIRSRYHGASVAAYFPKGSQSPVKYVNC